jgi:hypothetical protein
MDLWTSEMEYYCDSKQDQIRELFGLIGMLGLKSHLVQHVHFLIYMKIQVHVSYIATSNQATSYWNMTSPLRCQILA